VAVKAAPPAAPRPPAPPAAASDATQFIVAHGTTPPPHPAEQMRKAVGPGVDIGGETALLTREAALEATRMGGGASTGFFKRPDFASGEAEVGHTFVMAAPAVQAEKARRIEDEGEAIEVSAHRPFLLDDVESVYYVVEGGLLIFTVALDKGAPVGQRTHFLGIGPGQCCFGFDLKGYALGSGFLVVPKQGSKIRRIPVSRLQQLSRLPQQGDSVACYSDTGCRFAATLGADPVRGYGPSSAPFALARGKITGIVTSSSGLIAEIRKVGGSCRGL